MLTFIVGIVFLLILYYYIKHVYFTLRGSIPGLAPQFLLGNLFQTGVIGRDTPLNVAFVDMKAKFGDIFQYWLGPSRIIVDSNPEDLQHIFNHRHIYDQGDVLVEKLSLAIPYGLISLRGNKYKRHSNIVNQLFRRHKINAYLDPIIDCTDKLLNRWCTSYNDPSKVHLNMIEQCQQLLLAIFGYIAFDYDLQILDDQCNSKKNELTHALDVHQNAVWIVVNLPTSLARIYLALNPQYRRALSTINRYLNSMIEQELRETEEVRIERKRTSLIASLVHSLPKDEKLEENKLEEEKKGLSRDEVIGEMLLFLSAGFGTMSTALVWFIFHISKYPHIQKKIKNELSQFEKERLSIEQLHSLVYLECVLQEVLRFTPPAIGAVRTVTNDDQLPGTGAHLYKGDHIFLPAFSYNRDPRNCPGTIDPDQFYPERFLNTENEKNIQINSMTFGGGHRQCVGQDLARFELKCICARLMQLVTFGDGGDELNAGGYKQTDTLLPKHIGVTITFEV